MLGCSVPTVADQGVGRSPTSTRGRAPPNLVAGQYRKPHPSLVFRELGLDSRYVAIVACIYYAVRDGYAHCAAHSGRDHHVLQRKCDAAAA